MRDLKLETTIGKEKVVGVNALDLRKEMEKAFANKEYIPNLYQDQFTDDFRDSGLFMAVLDVAAFAAQCAVRRANGFDVPEANASS